MIQIVLLGLGIWAAISLIKAYTSKSSEDSNSEGGDSND